MERYYMYRAGGFESPEQLKEYLDGLGKPRPSQEASTIDIMVFALVLVAGLIVLYLEVARAVPAPQARLRGAGLGEAEGEAPGNNTSDHKASPRLLSENTDADGNIHEDDIPPPGPCKQDVPPTSPPYHSDAGSDPPEQDIAGYINSKDASAGSSSELLYGFEVQVRRLCGLFTVKGGEWVTYRTLVLLLRDDPKLRQYSMFQDQNPRRAGPMLKMLQGPVKHIPGSVQATTETKSVHGIIEFDKDVMGIMGRWLPTHADFTKGMLELNAVALELMRGIASDSGPSALPNFDGLIKVIEHINQLILDRDIFIDTVLRLLENALAKRQGILDELVRTATCDGLIALMKVPSGWETVQAENGPVARGSGGPEIRGQGVPTEGPRSGPAMPADIVDNVYELSQTFRGPSKETIPRMPDAVVQESSLLSRFEDPQQAEEIRKLREAQDTFEKLRVEIGRLQMDHQTSRTDRDGTIKDQASQATDVFASKVKACLEKDILQLGGSMRERWQRYVRSITGTKAKQPETITPATAAAHPITSADGGSTITTIIG